MRVFLNTAIICSIRPFTYYKYVADHQFMCMKIRLAGGYHRRKEVAGSDGRRYDASKLVSDSRAEDESNQALRLEFQKQVAERVGAAWPTQGGVDEKWTAVSGTLIESADELVGKVKGHQPDWFRESMGTLKPFYRVGTVHTPSGWPLGRKTIWHGSSKHGLQHGGQSELQRTVGSRRKRKRQTERFVGKKVWKCIRDMQRGYRGLLPSRAVVIQDENSELCSSSTSQHLRWRRHFTAVLNVRSQCDGTAMEKVRQREVDEDLGSVPTAKEVTRALGKLKNGKAPVSSNVLSEMLMVAMKNGEFGQMVLDLVKAVRKDKRVPQEWVDAILKKGNCVAVTTGGA